MDEYKELLKKCYAKKNIKLVYVDKLIKSVYPWQARDYLISKIPNTNDYVPIDYNIYAIVKKLWKEGFITLGWDEGSERNMGFINLKNNKPTINKLIKLFSKDNIILDNCLKNIKPGKKMIEYETKILNLKTYKIYIGKLTDNIISIMFDYSIISKIHKLLNIRKTTKKPLPGSLSCAGILKIDYEKIDKIFKSSLNR